MIYLLVAWLTVPALPPQPPVDFGGATAIAPERWFSPTDYPSGANTSGLVGFAFDISVDGRAERCTITRSSGSSLLDQQTCRVFLRRARFKPARDADGDPRSTVGRAQTRWRRP